MIELYNVNKVYDGGLWALRDVSITVKKGEFVFLTGASGAGKTTLLKLIYAAENVSEGQILVFGRNVSRLTAKSIPYLRRNIGVVFQDYKLLPTKTVHENVAFALEVLGRPPSVIGPQVDQVLDLVGLADKAHRYPRQLSGGEQQRVSVARSFVNRPPIMLCDEPTGNLDSHTGEQIMAIFHKLHAAGTTVIIVTHEMDVAAQAKRIIRMRDGKIVTDEILDEQRRSAPQAEAYIAPQPVASPT